MNPETEILAELTDQESLVLRMLFTNVQTGKANVYDAQFALELAQKQAQDAINALRQAESDARAAISTIGMVRGLGGNYGVSPDMKSIVRR